MPTPTRRDGALVRFFRGQPVTAWLITANIAVFVATVVQSRSILDNARSALFDTTALYPPFVVARDEWWRLLTSAFQHIGPLHLLLNMYILWILGMGIERSVGHTRYLALYLVSALGGSAAVMLYSQNAVTAGASGAIFGLMGAYGVVAAAMKLEFRGIALLIGLNIVVSVLVPGVSLAAHVGGLVVGALGALALVVLPRRLPASVGRGGREAVSWVAMIVVALAVAGVCWYAADTMTVGVIYSR